MAHCFITDINKMCYQQIPSNFESPKSNFYFTVLANLHKTFIPPHPPQHHNSDEPMLYYLLWLLWQLQSILKTNLHKHQISKELWLFHRDSQFSTNIESPVTNIYPVTNSAMIFFVCTVTLLSNWRFNLIYLWFFSTVDGQSGGYPA